MQHWRPGRLPPLHLRSPPRRVASPSGMTRRAGAACPGRTANSAGRSCGSVSAHGLEAAVRQRQPRLTLSDHSRAVATGTPPGIHSRLRQTRSPQRDQRNTPRKPPQPPYHSTNSRRTRSPPKHLQTRHPQHARRDRPTHRRRRDHLVRARRKKPELLTAAMRHHQQPDRELAPEQHRLTPATHAHTLPIIRHRTKPIG
jgi:hypothetical protein